MRIALTLDEVAEMLVAPLLARGSRVDLRTVKYAYIDMDDDLAVVAAEFADWCSGSQDWADAVPKTRGRFVADLVRKLKVYRATPINLDHAPAKDSDA